MDDKVLDQISDYLFSRDSEFFLEMRSLLKSFYHGKAEGLSGSAADLVRFAADNLPDYCKGNLSFAYSYTNRLKGDFIRCCKADRDAEQSNKEQASDKQQQKQAQQAQEAANDALDDTMQQYGMEQHPDGQKHQDDLAEKAQEDAEILLGGFLASKSPATISICEMLRQIDMSTKAISKTLANVSAIAEALLEGLEKVKSQWAETGYEYGRDIANIDPSEFCNLASEETKQLFLLKYAKGELLQETSTDKKGLGDLIICIDTSGSVFADTKQGYKVLDLEVGIAFAMCKLALKNKCRATVILYHTKAYDVSEQIRTKDQMNEYFTGILNGQKVVSGGTSFDAALEKCCEILKEKQYSKRKPGIIFITDGSDSVSVQNSLQVTELSKKLGVKLYSYFVSQCDPRRYAQTLIDISKANYWIDADKKIENQVSCFEEI